MYSQFSIHTLFLVYGHSLLTRSFSFRNPKHNSSNTFNLNLFLNSLTMQKLFLHLSSPSSYQISIQSIHEGVCVSVSICCKMCTQRDEIKLYSRVAFEFVIEWLFILCFAFSFLIDKQSAIDCAYTYAYIHSLSTFIKYIFGFLIYLYISVNLNLRVD